MGRILMNAAVGDILDMDSLDAEPMEVVEKRSFIGRYGIIQTGEMKYNLSGTEAADIVAPGDDYLHLRIPMGAYTDRYDNNDQYNTEVIAKYADIRPKVGYINQNHVLEGVTILGAPGKMKNFAGLSTWICGYEHSSVQVHPQDPNQALVKGLVNANSGFIEKGSTEIEFNIANAVPKNIRYGVKIGRTEYGDWGADDTNTITGEFTGDATAMASQILSGRTAYVKGNKVTGTLAVNSAFSFSIAAISGTEIEIYWTNPSKGPYSGVFIEMSTSGYPTAGNSTRVYTGLGTNSNPGGRSSCKITGLQPQTKYYFTANSYCNGLPNGNAVNLTATTKTTGSKIFTSSQSWTIPYGVTKVDVFLVGGGCCGAKNINSNEKYIFNRCGGSSGKTVTYRDVDVSTINVVNIVIGSGANNVFNNYGGRSNFEYYTVDGGIMSELTTSDTGWNNGGSGGGDYGYSSVKSYTIRDGGDGGSDGSNGTTHQNNATPDKDYGLGQGITTKAFGEFSGTLYAGGGGGGGYSSRSYSATTNAVYGIGGAGGGGNGGNSVGGNDPALPDELYLLNGQNATPNTGSGGGGSGGDAFIYRINSDEWVTNYGTPGNGASGVVIVRWK